VMFGGSALAGFALTEEDRQHGRYTLTTVVDCAYRCTAAGRFQPEDPVLKAHHMWLGVHGTVLLDVGGYLVPPYDASRCFESQLVSLMIGAGDDPESAVRSVTVSRDRFAAGFGQAT
jgi:Tetracyclin repressor-like, C-terminal domain